MFKSKKVIWVIGVLVIIAGLYFLVSSLKTNQPVSDKNPVVIGALFPLTGGLASYGEPAQKVAQLATEEINSWGGINGQKLVINFQDHKCDPKLAVAAFQQLNSGGKVKLFTAVGCSGTVISLAPQLKDAVLLGAAVTSPKISGVSPMVFRNYAVDQDEARLFAEEIKKQGYQKVGIIYEETDYAKGLKLSLEKFLEGSGVGIVSEGFVTGPTDVRTQVTKMKAANLDVLFVSPQTVTTGDLVLGEMIKQSYKPKALIVNENILKSTDLLTRYSSLLEGTVSADYILADNSRLNDLLKNYQTKYGESCPQKNICATVYDNVYMLAQAAKRGGSDSQQVAAVLKNINYDGVSGRISFNDKNDRSGAGYTLFVIKNGQAVKK